MELSKPKGEPVYLNIYSLGSWNCILSFFGIGVYHTGVEIYGTEFWYGGHDNTTTGIMRSTPGELGLSLEEKIFMGYTQMSYQELKTDIHFLDKIWIGTEYEPFSHNCNDFSRDFLYRILQVEYFPPYINRFSILKPLFKIWFAPLKFLYGDLVRAKRDRDQNASVKLEKVTTFEAYKRNKIKNFQDFLTIKEAADSYYMVNSYGIALNGYNFCISQKTHCPQDYAVQHVYIAAANCCWKLGKYEEMETIATMCINSYPRFVAGYVKRSSARKMLKNLDAGYEDLVNANKLAPNDPLVLEELRRYNRTRTMVQISP